MKKDSGRKEDSLILGDVIYTLGTATGKGSVGHLIDRIDSEWITEGIKTIGGEVLKEAAGLAVGPLLRIILNLSSNIAKRVRDLEQRTEAIETSITRIYIHSYILALQIIEESLDLNYEKIDERTFRNSRLSFAINELERTRILTDSPGAQYSGTIGFSCMIIQGLTALLIPGTQDYSRKRFMECKNILKDELTELNQNFDQVRKVQESLVKRMDEIKKEVGAPKIKMIKIAGVSTEMFQTEEGHRSEIEMKTRKENQRISELKELETEIKERMTCVKDLNLRMNKFVDLPTKELKREG